MQTHAHMIIWLNESEVRSSWKNSLTRWSVCPSSAHTLGTARDFVITLLQKHPWRPPAPIITVTSVTSPCNWFPHSAAQGVAPFSLNLLLNLCARLCHHLLWANCGTWTTAVSQHSNILKLASDSMQVYKKCGFFHFQQRLVIYSRAGEQRWRHTSRIRLKATANIQRASWIQSTVCWQRLLFV